jgi:DNA-binding GntR family transcriptional regulator
LFSTFLSENKGALTAIKKRGPEAARKAMDSLLSKTRDFLEREVLRGPAPRRSVRWIRSLAVD